MFPFSSRDVHASDFGRVCPIETPQGEGIGLNLHLTQRARINHLGMIDASYTDATSDKEVFLNPYEEESGEVVVAEASCEVHGSSPYVRTHVHELWMGEKSQITTAPHA